MSNAWDNNAWGNASKAASKATPNTWDNAPQPQPQSGSIWDNFEEIDTAPQRNGYVPAGLNCQVEVIELKVIQSVKNNNRPIFIATIQTLDDEPTRYDWVAKADERAYLQNIKAFVCGLNPQGDPRSFGREVMEELTGPSQPARGKRVHLRSEQILTRSGNEFTKCHWSAARS